ncbi:MAG: phage tail sheath subtilisin-like domain-containing protein [Enhydrobacter sp.]|nr:phage tail sheath subtilisin-like domain-containing protein [Enhydrobacter sp.]
MTIPFSQIPQAFRLPGLFAEVDASKASRTDDPGRILLIGQKLAAGTATANVPIPVVSVADAKAQFGVGSQLADMVDAVRLVDPFGLIWAVPVADAGGAVKATGTIVVSAAPTAPGVIPLYVAGVAVPVPVAGTETTTTTGDAIAAAINANADLPVTAANVTGTVTLTARNAGTLGSDIDLRYAWLGSAGGEALPDSYVGAITAMASGATDPNITTALAALGDQTFDFIVMPYTDATNLAAIKAAMAQVGNGRWAYNRMVWGHAFTARRGSVSSLVTFGLSQNDPHTTVLGYSLSPTPVWRWAAGQVAAAAIVLRNDPARPVQGIAVPGLLSPPPGAGRFTQGERNTLLYSGISTFTVAADGAVMIERLIATWQLNAFSQPDESWLSIEKTYTLMRVLRRLQAAWTANFPRFKLANDGTRFSPNAAIVTPAIAKAFVVAEMRAMEYDGLLSNVTGMLDVLAVERNAQNPDRLDVLFPPPLIAQLRMTAVLAQFRISANA